MRLSRRNQASHRLRVGCSCLCLLLLAAAATSFAAERNQPPAAQDGVSNAALVGKSPSES